MKLVVYGDFNCPYSCLASFRLDRLIERQIVETSEWRAVEHDTDIPAPGRLATGDLADDFEREVTEIRGLLLPDETFPITPPPVQPSTHLASARFATVDPAARPDARRELFSALWFDGRDIGQKPILDELLPPPTRDGAEAAAAWQGEWAGFEKRLVPTLLLPDGVVSRGLGALKRLADLAAA